MNYPEFIRAAAAEPGLTTGVLADKLGIGEGQAIAWAARARIDRETAESVERIAEESHE